MATGEPVGRYGNKEPQRQHLSQFRAAECLWPSGERGIKEAAQGCLLRVQKVRRGGRSSIRKHISDKDVDVTPKIR